MYNSRVVRFSSVLPRILLVREREMFRRSSTLQRWKWSRSRHWKLEGNGSDFDGIEWNRNDEERMDWLWFLIRARILWSISLLLIRVRKWKGHRNIRRGSDDLLSSGNSPLNSNPVAPGGDDEVGLKRKRKQINLSRCLCQVNAPESSQPGNQNSRWTEKAALTHSQLCKVRILLS